MCVYFTTLRHNRVEIKCIYLLLNYSLVPGISHFPDPEKRREHTESQDRCFVRMQHAQILIMHTDRTHTHKHTLTHRQLDRNLDSHTDTTDTL